MPQGAGARRGVLLMAYGTPRNLDEVEPYYRDIRGGRTPSPEAVAELRERYRRVGGRTPLLAYTRSVAEQLEARLNSQAGGDSWRAFVGMKHWHPYIAEAVEQIGAAGVRELTAIPLAPHYSKLSIGGYAERAREALERLADPPSTALIESWHANPLFIELIAERIGAALARIDAPAAETAVVFTAHSLPAAIVEAGDPYPQELLESAAAAARAAGVQSWRFAYQSAGKTAMPWLGPDILEALEEIAAEGRREVLVVPFGFVCDHLEILYDIDIEAQERACELGLTLARIAMPNDDPRFIDVLSDLARSGTGARRTQLGAAAPVGGGG